MLVCVEWVCVWGWGCVKSSLEPKLAWIRVFVSSCFVRFVFVCLFCLFVCLFVFLFEDQKGCKEVSKF